MSKHDGTFDGAVLEHDGESMKKWTKVALAFGYNELARMSQTLGERVFFRIARDLALEECRKAGVALRTESEDGDREVLVLREAMPRIAFQKRDIDMMREFLLSHGD